MNTSLIAALTNTEPSKLIRRFMSSGRVAATSAARSRATRATSTTLATDCFTIPMPMVSSPLARKILRSSSAPASTRATSPRRTTTPSSPLATTSWANSSAVRNGRSMRLVKMRSCEVREPAGVSTFSVRTARSMSLTVRPRAAMARRSSQTRMAGVRWPPIMTRATPSMDEKRSTR